jgi:hypothetical protein
MTWKEKLHLIFMNKNEPQNNDILEEEVKNEEEEIPTPQKAKKPLKNSHIFTAFLILILAIAGLGYLAYLTGHGLDVAEMFDQRSEELFLFIFMGISIVLLGVKMDIISWGTLSFLSMISIILIFIHLVGASIWPNWNPRNWAQKITKPEKEISAQRKENASREKTLSINSIVSLPFTVEPYEKLPTKFSVSSKFRYNLSAPSGSDYFLFIENKTEPIHIDKPKMELPDRPGVFYVMNGNKKTTITLTTFPK